MNSGGGSAGGRGWRAGAGRGGIGQGRNDALKVQGTLGMMEVLYLDWGGGHKTTDVCQIYQTGPLQLVHFITHNLGRRN